MGNDVRFGIQVLEDVYLFLHNGLETFIGRNSHRPGRVRIGTSILGRFLLTSSQRHSRQQEQKSKLSHSSIHTLIAI